MLDLVVRLHVVVHARCKSLAMLGSPQKFKVFPKMLLDVEALAKMFLVKLLS